MSDEKNTVKNEGEGEALLPDAPVEVVGVRFRDAGKTYYFAPGKHKLSLGAKVIVETARGYEYGFVSAANKLVPVKETVPPVRPVIRVATAEDTAHYEHNTVLEKEAFGICVEKIKEHKLDMKLINVEYTFDNSKLMFYFSSDGRVDFRELVRSLASQFRTRIELRQIGIRDEAKMLGGLGVCGRPLCCASFLSDFVQVSIKMAKEQNLSLNSAKISGTCGRLMCCLRYEHEAYEEGIRLTPPVGARVRTADGVGIVTDSSPLTGNIKVEFNEKQTTVTRPYHRDDVVVEARDARREARQNEAQSK